MNRFIKKSRPLDHPNISKFFWTHYCPLEGLVHFDTGKKYDMEIKIDKSEVMWVSRSNESLQIKVNI